jgi:long-chain acyl-CoA synthetase
VALTVDSPRTLAAYVLAFASNERDVAFSHTQGLRHESWTYGRVARLAFQLGREFGARGIAPGDRVIIHGASSPAWVAAFHACLLTGAVAVPLDADCAPTLFEEVVKQAAPRLLITDAMHQRTDRESLCLHSLEAVVAHHSAEPLPEPATRDSDLVEILFTSGATATPKGVRITQGNLLTNIRPIANGIEQYRRYERWFHPIRFLSLLPLSHVFGQFMGVFIPQLLAGEVIFQSSLSPTDIIDTIRRHRVSVVVAVPRILQTLQHKIERDAEAAGTLERLQRGLALADGRGPVRRWWMFRGVHRRFGLKFWAFVSGGAQLDAEVELFWRRLGFAVIQGYGMTETASLVSLNHPFRMSRGSIGRILPGHEVKLDEQGQILVRGDNVTPGYWGGEPDAARVDGWFATGDVGELDAEGNLFFKGRIKDVIVTAAGMNVHPQDLELALRAQPEITDACVVGIAGELGDEAVAAIIAEADHAGIAAAVARANESLADYQRVRRWVLWPEPDFPRTSTHKVRKPIVAAAVRSLLAGTGAVPAAESPIAELLSQIGVKPVATLDPNAQLGADLHLDSLSRVELLSALEDRYQVDIDESAIDENTTLVDIERLVQRGGAAAEQARYPYPYWAQRFPVTWLRRLGLYTLVMPFSWLLCWTRQRGVEHLRELRGPALFCSNHVTRADAALIMQKLPLRIRHRLAIAMAGELLEEYRAPKDAGLLLRWYRRLQYVLVVAIFNVFPLPQRSGFRKSFAFAGQAVDRGYSVLVFPEGARTPDGELHRFRSGAGILATRLGIPVVPVRIDGLYAARLRGRKFVRPGSVTVVFGEPVVFDAGDDPSRAAAAIERMVAEL